MNVLVAVNERYLEPLSVMLYSLSVHNNTNITVYILHFDIYEDVQENFAQKIAKWSKHIRVIFLQTEEDRFHGLVCSERYTNVANLRLLMLELLPVSVKRILWLDVDIIVQGSLQQLYEYIDKGQYAVVCEDMFSYSEKKEILSKLGLNEKKRYFNSGVMLFYLDNMRRDFKENIFLEWMYENPDKLKYPDQNALNVCLRKKLVWVKPEIYNLQLVREKKKEALKRAKVLHYNMREKPWNDDYIGLGELLYWKYAMKVLGIKKMFVHFWSKMRGYVK